MNKIVFFNAYEGQRKEALKLKKRMKPEGFIEIWNICDLDKSGYLNRCTEEILFAADEGTTLNRLKENGASAIAWLHNENEKEDMSGAVFGIMDVGEMDYESLEKAYQRAAGIPWTIAETKRCIIRETTVADVEAFYFIYKEPSISYFMENLYTKPEEEISYTREYIEKVYGLYGYGLWSIVDKASGTVIGRAGLSWREGYDIPELGFMIAVPFQRRGYAFEVCSSILNYGAENLEFKKVQALIKKENEASVMLCRKLGFKRDSAVEEGGTQFERYIWGNQEVY